MKFYCKQCKVVLTRELSELQDKNLLSNEPGADYLPQGFYVSLDPNSALAPSSEGQAGLGRDVVINLKDLVNVRAHTDPSRNNGCCGLDGTDGFNTLCVNLHEIGTESSDCWMAHECTLDAGLVQARTVKTYALSAYKLDLGQPLLEFVRGLHVCADDHLLDHIASGAVEIDGVVVRDASQVIDRNTIKHGSCLTLLDQEVRFQLWVDDDGLR
jgi:hypothetical protein